MSVGIVGVGETPFKLRHDAAYPDLAATAAHQALEMAGMTVADVDAVVFSLAPTQLMGVADGQNWVAGALGAVGKPFLRINTGGTSGGSAVQAAYWHVGSGEMDTVLVVGADKVTETPNAQHIFDVIWDPIFERRQSLNAITMAACQAVRHMDTYGTTEEQLAAVAVQSWGHALDNPNAHLKGEITVEDVMASKYLAWPIKMYDACPRSSGAAAMVMSSGRRIAERGIADVAWIRGAAGTSAGVFMGDRMGPKKLVDYGSWQELGLAAERAYAQAGITDPAAQIDVAELYTPFTSTQVMAVEALGFVKPGEGGPAHVDGFFGRDGGEVVVNPSGGTLCANPIGATGLVRACDAALQLLGKAPGESQVDGARTAVTTAIGGSFQFHTCTVLSTEPGE